MGVVHWILEDRDGNSILVTQVDVCGIPVRLVLEHPGFGDNTLHLLQHAPAKAEFKARGWAQDS